MYIEKGFKRTEHSEPNFKPSGVSTFHARDKTLAVKFLTL